MDVYFCVCGFVCLCVVVVVVFFFVCVFFGGDIFVTLIHDDS